MDITPFSILSTECKILARILARRLRHILADQLQNIQFCGVPGNSVLDTISSVRDFLAHYESTGTPLRILSLDFQNAFDLISHKYLFHILPRYGISPWFKERIYGLYE